MSDLISLRVLLMLEIYLLDKTINLSELTKLIRTITYFLNGSFIVMLSLDFSFFGLLRTLYTLSIFFDFYDILNIALRGLSIWLITLRSCRKRVYAFLGKFWFFQDFLAQSWRNRKRNPGNNSLFTKIRSFFVVRLAVEYFWIML